MYPVPGYVWWYMWIFLLIIIGSRPGVTLVVKKIYYLGSYKIYYVHSYPYTGGTIQSWYYTGTESFFKKIKFIIYI